MKAPGWGLVLLATIVTAFVTPVWGQANSGTRSAASIPNFSGNWSHLFFPDVDLPLSGPGPVTNKARLPSGVSNPGRLVGDHTNPILKPEAAEVVRKHGEISLSGATYPTPSNQCWPGGVPYIFWDLGMQVLQEQDKITILYAFNNEVRHIRLNQTHPTQVKPSWYGDSVGHYEGETLVIDTVGVKIGPFAMADMYGTPHTQALHVVERYRLISHEAAKEAQERAAKYNFRVPEPSDFGWSTDPDYESHGLELAFTVEDEGALTMPWSATVTYRRPLGEWPEFLCAEGRDYFVDSAIPSSKKPDF